MKRSALFVLLTLLAVVVSAKLLFIGNSNKNPEPVQPSVTPSPVPANQKAEVHSPDGLVKVVLQKEVTDGVARYTVTTSDIDGSNPVIILAKSTLTSESITIPANSWSPDDKLLFLKDEISTASSARVFKASGETFTAGEQYLDVNALFDAKKTGFTISDVTGWDSPTLLHIYTMADATTLGPAFWFDVPSKSFLRLAR